MILRYKKIHHDAKAPLRATDGAAGWDLFCVDKEYDSISDAIICHTGLAVEIPAGYVGLLFPRSSIYKLPIFMPYSVGVVDSDYRGEILAIFKSCRMGQIRPSYQVGERCCQLVINELPKVDGWEAVEELSETARGTAGYGSTGLK